MILFILIHELFSRLLLQLHSPFLMLFCNVYFFYYEKWACGITLSYDKLACFILCRNKYIAYCIFLEFI